MSDVRWPDGAVGELLYEVRAIMYGKEMAECWLDRYGWKQQRFWRTEDRECRGSYKTRREAEAAAKSLLDAGWDRVNLIVPPRRLT